MVGAVTTVGSVEVVQINSAVFLIVPIIIAGVVGAGDVDVDVDFYVDVNVDANVDVNVDVYM